MSGHRPWWSSPLVAPADRARAFTTRGAVGAAAAVVALVATASLALAAPSGPTVRTSGSGVIYTSPSARGVAHGCTDVVQVPNPTSRVGWIETDNELPYVGVVPSAGWFAPDAPDPGALTATPEQVLRAMWSGERAAWYAPTAPKETVEELREVVAANPGWNMRVWQWPEQRRDQMPAGTEVAFSSWGISQMCELVDTQVISDMLELAEPAPGAHGGEPDPVIRATPEPGEPATTAER